MEESEKSDISFWIYIYVYSTDAAEKSVKQTTSLKAAFSDIHEKAIFIWLRHNEA